MCLSTGPIRVPLTLSFSPLQCLLLRDHCLWHLSPQWPALPQTLCWQEPIKEPSEGWSVVEAVTLLSPSHSNTQYSPSFQSRFGPGLFSSQTCTLGHVTPSKSPTLAPSACSPRHQISSFALASGPYVGTQSLAMMSWNPESSCHVRYTSSQVLS